MLNQFKAILRKNFLIEASNKKKLLAYLINTIILILFSWFYFKNKDIPVLKALLGLVLKLILGFNCIGYCAETVTRFITERQQKFRQYQIVMGVSMPIYLYSNLLYAFLLYQLYMIPVIIYLLLANFYLGYIVVFPLMIASCLMVSLFISSFFTDFKIAAQAVSLFFTTSTFLAFMYNHQQQTVLNYFILMLPNSAFAIAVMQKQLSYSLYSIITLFLALFGYTLVEFRVGPCKLLSFRKQQMLMVEEQQLGDQSGVISSLSDEINPGLQNDNFDILEINNLVKTYSDVTALAGVSFKIQRSQIFALLGRNGSGKTTIVDIVTNVINQTSGDSILKTKTNNPIGICYQKQILYEDLTIEQHLSIYAQIKNISGDYQRLIIDLGLEEHRTKKVKQLSGGNKRKLSAAIAILGQPQLIIFDEPTSGLDPLSRRQMWKILSELKQGHSTILLTTHHLDEADFLSDRICVIDKGRVVAEDKPSMIKQKYGKGYHLIIKVADDSPGLSSVKKQILRILPLAQQLDNQSNMIRYFIDFNRTQQKNVLELIESLQQNQHLSITLQANTLEHSFLSIIRNLGANQITLGVPQYEIQPQASPTIPSQIYGMFLRSVYIFKAQPALKIINYNINLLTIIFTYFFTKFITNIVANNIDQQDGDARQKGLQAASKNGTVILTGYYFMALAFIMIPVTQKQNRIINVLRTRGVGPLAYWMGTFLFDFMMFSINLGLLYVLAGFSIMPAPPLLLILGTGVGMIIYTYCCSFLFTKLKTAANWFMLINIMIGLVGLPVLLFGKLNANLQNIAFLRILYPLFDLSYWAYGLNETFQPLLIDLEFQALPITIILYLTILLVIQIEPYKRFKSRTSPVLIHKDVRFQNITKTYNSTTTALNNVSFEAYNERIALLGHNGAGKSTAFDLITCQLQPTFGNLYVEGKQKKPYNHVLSSVGVCYQTDALWQTLTTDQILKIFCKLTGVKDYQTHKRQLYQNLEFQYANKRFDRLSGGNKRKMCMAVALVGNPRIKLLDQCSTGLDPSSRQSMVSTIKSSERGLTIFTTHSMPEAEDLCSKSLILQKGVIRQYGYNHVLREKYYSCFWIDLDFGGRQNDIEECLRNIEFPCSNTVIKVEQNLAQLQIAKQNIKLSELFGFLVKLKKNNVIKDFRVLQPKLEDVYLKLTGQQALQE